ncbi:FtsX-like permease family protein [Streptomyces sp. TLI_185]|uniref:FtsX-like permease family protein n=1 Tax=Streptomyces sp. TLI_185 TaxID=2485151 RepID=UPI000F4D4DE8|nr:FtsX-like permease family protein [Streptomyces sp. TLI_185]RPF33579.1 putative ABC transport system permease protein [Streptomyces sp. TLI_185]
MNAVPAPWVLTRLRAAPGAACALALLVALTACLAAAFPRAVDRYEDAALRRAVERARPATTGVGVWARQPSLLLPREQREEALLPGTLAAQYTKVRAAVPGPLVVDPDQSTYGVRTNPQEVPDRWLPRPSGLPAQMSLAAQHGLADHATVRSGRLPRTAGRVTAATAGVEAAVTVETAERLHIKVGSVIHVPGEERAPLAVRVTGIVTPRDPGGAYWAAQPLLRTPDLVLLPGNGADPDKYWVGSLLLAPEAAPAMLGTAGSAWRYWQLAPSPAALHAHEVDRLKSAVASLEAGPVLRKVRTLTDPTTTVSTDLDDVLGGFTGLRSGVRPLVAVAAFGTGTVAAVVLLMAGGLAADRRRAELTLLRARGASLPGLAGRLLAETAVAALPAGAAGLAVALLALPGGRASYAIAAAATVTAVACAALPLRAAAVHRAVRIHGGRADVTSVRPSRRRTVAELTLVVVALGAVETLRRRGTTGDQLTALAPVLVGVVAALMLVRLYPLPLRGLARPAARLRGALGHLSLARAGRTSASAVLPLLALLTALTTAAFGGSVLAGVREARDQAALLAVGADARIETTSPLPPGLPDRIRRTPGVQQLAVVSITYQAKPTDLTRSVPLAGVDPRDYAELTSRTGLGPFPEGELREKSGHGALPALASPAVARTYGTRPFPVRLEDGTTVTVRIAVVRDRTPAVTGDNFLVVDRAGLNGPASLPTALLLTGTHLNGPALRRTAPGSADVQLRTEERARYADSPLQTGAERVYTTAVAAGAGYAVLALLVSLLRTAPERTALLARLRTMGLTRTQGRRLLILESLPQAVLAAAGGTLTGWATIRLLSPGVDLTTIALASARAPATDAVLRTDAMSLVVPAAAIVLVTVGVAGVQAWWTGRRGAVAELRAGDAR